MKNPNTIEKDLNAVRVSLYEETKNMSPSELTAHIKEQTEPILKKHGITPVRSVHAESGENNRFEPFLYKIQPFSIDSFISMLNPYFAASLCSQH